MKPYILLTAFVLAGIIPFSSRAVFMDEHIFLQIASSAERNWAFPQDTPGMFFGTPLPNFNSHTHPPVVEYYLALLYAVVGRFSEVPFRLLFAVFPVAAVLGFYSLARRFTQQPLLVSLLFAASPAFFVMSSTLMMDIPMLAFLIVGMAFYLGAVEGRRGYLAAAGGCFVLATGTGYTALVPLGCLFLGMLAAGRPRKELFSIAVAPAALALWLLLMKVHFGEFPVSGILEFYASQDHSVLYNTLVTLSFLGGVAFFPWTIATGVRPALVGFALASALSMFVSISSIGYRVWFVVLTAFGIALLTAFAKSAAGLIASGKNRGEAMLMLWTPAVLLFFIGIGDMINARYILLALPPLFLLLLRGTSASRLVAALIPTVILSTSLAYADFVFVNSYRAWVQDTIPRLQRQGFRVWNAGESGLRFNLEQLGISSLTYVDTRPLASDLVVRQQTYRYSLSAPVATMLTVLKTFTLNHPFPIRTYNPAAGAGFHDSRFGIVPYTFSQAPFDIIEVAQISPFAEPLPRRENNPAWSPKGVIFKQSEPEIVFPMNVPSQTKLEYEVEGGEGTADIMYRGIRLRKRTASTIVWKSFRIVPVQFLQEKN